MGLRNRWMWLARTGGALIAAVFLLGVLSAAFHSHGNSEAEQGCVVCALADNAAVTPAIVAVPIANVVELRLEPVAGTLAPSCAPRRGTSPRAPPLS